MPEQRERERGRGEERETQLCNWIYRRRIIIEIINFCFIFSYGSSGGVLVTLHASYYFEIKVHKERESEL